MSEPTFPTFDASKYDEEELLEFQQVMGELHDIKLKAIKTAIKDKYTQYYKKLIDEEQYEHFPSYCEMELRKLHKLKVKADNITDIKQGNNSHAFFTVNFKPDCQDFENIHEVMNDFTTKCKFVKDDFMYAIEQRSEELESAGSGAHVHILFKKGDNAPSKIERAFKQKFFDKYVGNPAHLDYRYITSDKVEEKMSYILGIKKKEKMCKVLIDRQHRLHKNVKDFYCTEQYLHNAEKIVKNNELNLRF